jgi:hypothetical protein
MVIKYTRKLVISKAKQLFPDHDIAEIMQLLDAYGKKCEREKERVQLAVLKLSKGDLEELKKMVESAKLDYRDVLCSAEYPKQSSHGFAGWKKLTKQEKDKAIAEDLRQYLKWLK